MGKVKELMLEAEEMLEECLGDAGMTNEQAFEKIRRELGSMAESHARQILDKWNKEDEVWQQ